MKRQWVKLPLGKQNIQAKNVYWATLGGGVSVMGHPFLCYFEKVNTLEIVGKIFWKRRSGDIFLHVTASFFKETQFFDGVSSFKTLVV